MKPARLAAPVAALALALAGCANSGDAGAPSTGDLTPPPSATDSNTKNSDSSTREVNSRNNVVKKIGEKAWIPENPDGSGAELIAITVNGVEVTDSCKTEFSTETPASGKHFIVIDMSVATHSKMRPEMSMLANPHNFSLVGPDGITDTNLVSMNGGMCYQDEQLAPAGVQPGQKYRGKVVLESEHASGQLILSGPTMEGGWEWPYGGQGQ